MPAKVHDLLEVIRAATSFEEAGLALLRQLFNVVRNALSESPFAAEGKVRRGQIHLRNKDTYRQVLVASWNESHGNWIIERNAPRNASTEPWLWMNEQQSVGLASNQPQATSQSSGERSVPSAGGESEGRSACDSSAGESKGLPVTHMFTVLLRASSSGQEGKVCIEFFCPSALGHDYIWDGCTERLQVYCDKVASYLLRLPAQLDPHFSPSRFLPVVGASMVKTIEMLRVFARQEETLLIGGPTGSGKSRLARWCHEQSPRRQARYESLDLSNTPETLQMAELCGWKKGAFTDAHQDTPGALARAEGGTLFIDEIDKLSFKAQAGLLYLLEERRYRVLGERSGEREANVRFIVGTNADLVEEVRARRFREDLYYRLNVLPVRVPPLFDRQDEIIPWARYMLQRRHGKAAGAASLTSAAEALLLEQQWPGNLRQLDNIIRRAYALCLLSEIKPGAELVMDRQQIERALAWEVSPSRTRPLSEIMMEAAESFVRLAQQRSLDLDQADAFRGFVLAAAVRQMGDRDEAFKLLGKEQLVRNRNHHKLLKRELARAATFVSAIGETPTLSGRTFAQDEPLDDHAID